MREIPRIVIAGAHSGAGKTSLSLGLITLLRRRGLRVQAFKVGPDYLDPTWLAAASGRPCYNRDGWVMCREYVEGFFLRATADCDVALIEGVMGLFDGADATAAAGSTAEIAHWLRAPVLLTVNTHGMARSLAALALGYARFDPAIQVAGVLANQCGSENHAQLLRQALSVGAGLPLLGTVRRGVLPTLASRHLGLVGAGGSADAPATIERLAEVMADAVDVDGILRLARQAAPLAGTPSADVAVPRRFRLGVARDAAFHFYYLDNLEALERAGCELIYFSPLTDRELPERLDGIYLGGGYPEEYAAAMTANVTMRAAIRDFPRLLYAECGGLMYLSDGIETADGARYPQVGRLPVWVRMRTGRRALGYVEVTCTRAVCWGAAGETLRGHEYHYSELISQPAWDTAYTVRARRAGASHAEGFASLSALASYIHLHFASRPQAVENFMRVLDRQQKNQPG